MKFNISSLYGRRNMKILIFIFVFALIIFRAINVSFYDDTKGRNNIRGDSYSDLNTYSTVLFYNDFPFSEKYGLPVWRYDGKGDTTGTFVYTHYPSLPDITTSVYSRILQNEGEVPIRLFAVLMSVIFFFVIYGTVNAFVPDKKIAFVSASIIVLSNYFIAWADGMHKHTLEELLKWLYVWLMLLYYRAENKPVLIVAGLCLIYVAIINISFEPVPYLAIMTVAFSWVFTRKIFTPLNLLLAAMPILGFSIHLYQNFHHFGTWAKVFEDMNHAAADRVKGVAKGELHRALTFKEYLELPFLWFNRMERFYLIPGWSFLVLMLLGMKRVKRENIQTFKIFVALAFCSVCWSFLMSQHYYIHTFTSRHWGLFFGLIIGYGLFEYRRLLLQTWKSSGIAMKVFHVIFIGYTVAMALSQQVWDLYIRYGFGYLYFEDKL